MKNKIYIIAICCLAVYSFSFSSCDDGDNGDTTKPVINLIKPEEGDSLKIGDEHGVHFDAEFSDDEALASYKLEIHNNFDNHGHEPAASPARSASAEATVDFTFEKTYDLSGNKNKKEHHHDVKIPANATPGNYHLMVYCTDAAGNEMHVARNIVLYRETEVVVNPDDIANDKTAPVIKLIEPEDGEKLLIGDTLGVHFDAELSDDVVLKSYKIEIHGNHVHKTETTVEFTFEKTYDLSGKKNADVHHHDIKIPENATPGNYHLVVSCTDAAGNTTKVEITVELSHDAEGHHDDDDDHHED
jgi:uncharacterized membrane protein